MKKDDYKYIECMYEYSTDIKNRKIYFFDDINNYTAESCIKGISMLRNMKDEPIEICCFSGGGDLDASFGIYDYLQLSEVPVLMKCFGAAYSGATLILQACSVRSLSRNCNFMIHYGSCGSERTHSKDFIESAEDLKRSITRMEDIYLERIREKHPKFTRKKLQELMKYDKYMTAKEAVELGLADEILN